LFVTTIYEKFVQSSLYEFTNRISDLTNLNYGKPKSSKPSIILSKELVISICKKILAETINYYLPRQDNRNQTTTVSDFLPSVDEVSEILQSEKSDTAFNSKMVDIRFVEIEYPEIIEKEFILNTEIQKEKQTGNEPTSTADGEAPKESSPPPRVRADSFSPGNTDAIFEYLFEQDGIGKIGIGDSSQIVVGGPRDGDLSVE
jgi:hypothetical protein